MPEEIINRVAQSALQVFDLEEHYPTGIRSVVDISQWLQEGILLKEKDFREKLSEYDWKQYQDHLVAIYCDPDIIIPAWSSILVASYLIPYAKRVVYGTLDDLETILFEELIPKLDFSKFENKPVILKGCSKKPVPLSAYLLAMKSLQPVAKSIMYGEACSAVPLYKRNK